MSRPMTHFVDWQAMEHQLTARQVAHREPRAGPHRSTRRLLTSVDEEAGAIRTNVRDSAAAVVQWLASVMDHEGAMGPDEVVDRCLRPGPDLGRINYAAMADEINRQLAVGMTAKRLRTAIAHLRARHAAKPLQMHAEPSPVSRGLSALRNSLQTHHLALTAEEPAGHEILRRRIGLEILAAVRCAAGRIIENDYGEGIPEQIDLNDLEDAFLDWVRHRRVVAPHDDCVRTRSDDLHRLLVTICDYEASVDCDIRLVLAGHRVVTSLFGPGSLPGILGELNVLVAGRSLIDSPTYVAELLRLARAATRLHDDPDTRRLIQWARRRREVPGTPSPLRVRSYCLNNACTHVLEQLHRGTMSNPVRWVTHAATWFRQMTRRDSGFELVRTTHVLLLTVEAHLTGNVEPVRSHFRGLGRQRTLDVIRDMYRFDSCVALCRAAESQAATALPAVRHQLLHAG